MLNLLDKMHCVKNFSCAVSSLMMYGADLAGEPRSECAVSGLKWLSGLHKMDFYGCIFNLSLPPTPFLFFFSVSSLSFTLFVSGLNLGGSPVSPQATCEVFVCM